ncbi:MAG: hypothetical protein WCW84_03915 [Sulfurimonas sp.]|jgi:hypothetical protein
MRFSIIALCTIVGFSGCAQKGAFDMFKMDEAHERSVEQLRTGAILESLETKALVSAIYLNPVYPQTYTDGEYFIGAFYFSKGLRNVKKWDIETFGYSLTLNGKKATSIEELKESDPKRALIPVQNNWNKYYFIRFDSVQEGNLTLVLESNQTGSVALSYPKGK